MFSVGYDDDSEAGMMSVKETPEAILGKGVVRNA
jgi:hypothetical protein